MILLACVLAVFCSCELDLLLASRDIKLCDGDRHLLLDHLNLVLQSGFRFSQSSGKSVNLDEKFLLDALKLLFGGSKTLLCVSAKSGQLLLKLGNSLKGLCLTIISILVSSGKLFSLMGQFSVISVHICCPLLQSFKLHLDRFELILQLSLVSGQHLIGHLQPVHIVAHLDDLLEALTWTCPPKNQNLIFHA